MRGGCGRAGAAYRPCPAGDPRDTLAPRPGSPLGRLPEPAAEGRTIQHFRLSSPGDVARASLHVATLGAIAIAQPLFELMGLHPSFLVAHRIEGGDLLLLAAGLGLGVPLLAALPTLFAGGVALFAAGAGPAAGAVVAASVALLAGATLLPPLHRSIPDAAIAPIAVAALLGALACVIYRRYPPVRSFATALSPALLLFPGLFLFHSPAGKLLQPQPRQFEPITTVEGRSPVVLVIFDALSLYALIDESDRVDAERYPNLAALAGEATWFRNASSVAEQTDIAVPAILTGRYPERTRLPTFNEHRQNLFTLLAGHYELEVSESVTHLCPKRLCEELELPEPRQRRMSGLASDLAFVYLHHLLPKPLRGSLPPVDQDWRGFGRRGDPVETTEGDELRSRAADTDWLFDRFLERIGGRDERVLHFIHLPVPHPPWKYLPSGRSYGPFPFEEIYYPFGHSYGGWSRDRRLVAQGLQRYLLQVGYVDHLVGRLVARLRETGLYDEALIVLVADHGESFVPGSSSRVSTPLTRSDILNVPMLVKLPGQRAGEVDDSNVETIDVLPTVAALLGVELPGPVDGRSLLGPAAVSSERKHKLLFRVPIGEEEMGRPNERFDLHAKLPGRLATAARTREWMNDDRRAREEGRGVLAMGPHRELHGRDVLKLEIVHGSGFGSTIEFAASYEDVDLDGRFIPARVTGEVHAREGAAAPESVAVALNGRIEATAHTFAGEGSTARFAAMLPESAFRQGTNEVEIFVLEEPAGPGGAPRIAATSAGTRAGYVMVDAADGRAALLLSSRGVLIPVVPGAIRGTLVENGLVLGGEARDLETGASAETALVFANGRFVSELPFAPPEPDERPGREASRTSRLPRFRLLVPYEHTDGSAPPGLRVFAVSRGRASELEYRSDFTLRGRGAPSQTRLHLERGGEGVRLVASDGTRVPLPAEPVRVRKRTLEEGGASKHLSLEILADSNAPAPLALLVFAGDRFALARAVEPARDPRQDATSSETGGPAGRYEITLPKASLQRLGSSKLRFAIVSRDGHVREVSQ